MLRRAWAESVSPPSAGEIRGEDHVVPRPTRPRRVVELGEPERAASCTIMIVVFGRSTSPRSRSSEHHAHSIPRRSAAFTCGEHRSGRQPPECALRLRLRRASLVLIFHHGRTTYAAASRCTRRWVRTRRSSSAPTQAADHIGLRARGGFAISTQPPTPRQPAASGVAVMRDAPQPGEPLLDRNGAAVHRDGDAKTHAHGWITVRASATAMALPSRSPRVASPPTSAAAPRARPAATAPRRRQDAPLRSRFAPPAPPARLDPARARYTNDDRSAQPTSPAAVAARPVASISGSISTRPAPTSVSERQHVAHSATSSPGGSAFLAHHPCASAQRPRASNASRCRASSARPRPRASGSGGERVAADRRSSRAGAGRARRRHAP